MKIIDNIYLDDVLLLNKLPDLKDVIVKGNFGCDECELTSLEGAPKYVGRDFNCRHNKVKFTEEYVRSLVQVKGKIFYENN